MPNELLTTAEMDQLILKTIRDTNERMEQGDYWLFDHGRTVWWPTGNARADYDVIEAHPEAVYIMPRKELLQKHTN